MFNQYILILIWIGFMALIQGNFCREEYNELTGEYDWRVSPLFAFIAFCPIIWMAGNRTIYIGDTVTYIKFFQQLGTTLSKNLLEGKDWGFTVFSIIFKKMLGSDSNLFLMGIAVIQGLILVYVFQKYAFDYLLAIFMFIASSDYISWMFNGVRQFIAVCIVFCATGLMLKKKYFPLLIVILVASTFHQSAILTIPFIIIAQGEAWNKKTLFFMMVTLMAVFFVARFTSFLDDALSYTQYANVVSDYTAWGDDGTSPFRVLVYSIPAILSFIGRNQIRNDENVWVNFCVNMSIISMAIYSISMVTSGIFIGRIPIYCSLYGYMVLPWEIEHIVGERYRGLIRICMILGYLSFYYYQMHIAYGIF